MDVFQSILQRVGIRQLPGICWYPAKRTGYTVNQGGTADITVLESLTFKTVFLIIRGNYMYYPSLEMLKN